MIHSYSLDFPQDQKVKRALVILHGNAPRDPNRILDAFDVANTLEDMGYTFITVEGDGVSNEYVEIVKGQFIKLGFVILSPPF